MCSFSYSPIVLRILNGFFICTAAAPRFPTSVLAPSIQTCRPCQPFIYDTLPIEMVSHYYAAASPREGCRRAHIRVQKSKKEKKRKEKISKAVCVTGKPASKFGVPGSPTYTSSSCSYICLCAPIRAPVSCTPTPCTSINSPQLLPYVANSTHTRRPMLQLGCMAS